MKNTGFLSKAQSILADVTPAFTTWVKRSGFKRAAVLSPVETTEGIWYYATDSFGFEAVEMARLNQSADYWRETLSKAFEWQCFSFDFNELDKFHDFFEDNVFEKISKIFFLPFGEKDHPFIFVTVELDDDDDLNLAEASETAVRLKNIKEFENQKKKIIAKLETNIEKGLEISPAMLLILSLKLWIKDSIKNLQFQNAEIEACIVESIAKTAMIVVAPLFRNPNCINPGKDGELKLVLFAKDEPDEQLLSHHISRTLRDFLGRSQSEDAKAQLLSAGICPNQKGTVAFLCQE